MKLNPAVQVVEWVRSAYYPELGLQVDYLYVILFALTCATIGLLLVKHVVSKQS